MKIVVGGQIEKEVLATALRTAFDARNTAVEVAVLNDIEAAMAIAILGAARCATLGMPGKILSDSEIAQQVAVGKVAFGFTAQDIDSIVPVVVKLLAEK